MEEITVFLEQTKPEQFLIWLVDTTRRLRNKYRYPAQVGQYSVDFAREVGPGEAEVLATYSIAEWTSEDKGSALIADFPVMVFHWLSVGERLKLRMEYITEPPLAAHVYLLMRELSKAWPGAKGSIESHFNWKLDSDKDGQTNLQESDRKKVAKDALRRVAVALFFFEKRHVTTLTDTARRAGTTPGTIN